MDRKRGEGRGIRGDKGRKVMTNCSCRERKQRRKSRKSQPADSISSCPSGILEVRHSRGRICTIFLETFFYQNSLSYAHRRATRHISAEQIASMECVTAVSNYHHFHLAFSHPNANIKWNGFTRMRNILPISKHKKAACHLPFFPIANYTRYQYNWHHLLTDRPFPKQIWRCQSS